MRQVDFFDFNQSVRLKFKYTTRAWSNSFLDIHSVSSAARLLFRHGTTAASGPLGQDEQTTVGLQARRRDRCDTLSRPLSLVVFLCLPADDCYLIERSLIVLIYSSLAPAKRDLPPLLDT